MAKKTKSPAWGGNSIRVTQPAGGLGQGFTPTPPAVAPAGTYDPSLDANLRAADRGLLYTQQDAERDQERLSTGYTAGKDAADRQQGYSLADLLTGYNRNTGALMRGSQRSLSDLLNSYNDEEQDFGKNFAGLQRSYKELGAGQTAAASSGSFVDTGSIQASGAVRAENKGRDEQDMYDSRGRFLRDNTEGVRRTNEDTTLGLGQLNEDYATGVTRTNEQHDTTVGELGRQLQYGSDDLATSLQRGGFENNFFHQDTDAAKMYQATTTGLYTPPTPASNEFTDSKGPYKLVVAHGLRFKERPNGIREPAGVSN